MRSQENKEEENIILTSLTDWKKSKTPSQDNTFPG
jgi:hypothetical protein